MRIDGREIAAELLNKLKPEVEKLKQKGITPTLAIILIGSSGEGKAYVKQKVTKAGQIGAEIKLLHFEFISEADLLDLIRKLNSNPKVHGIIVQRPLPKDTDRDKISRSVNPKKDVDGFAPASSFDAPVALAVWEILRIIKQTNLDGKKIVVIGKGETAGGPIIKLLKKHKIDPIVIDRETENPNRFLKSADIIISAVGKEDTIRSENLGLNQILIGVGLFSEDGKLVGDYNEEAVENKVKYFTPTPGGVGPVNVAYLMKNLIEASKNLSKTTS